jgi:salicylate biosynthesis isochorismate synthase
LNGRQQERATSMTKIDDSFSGTALQLLRQALATRDPRKSILVLTVPAPLVAVEQALSAFDAPQCNLWRPKRGPAYAAAGVVRKVELRGPDRFEQLRRGSEAIWAAIDARAPDGCARAPRLFGGLAFVPRRNDAPPWQCFGDGSFVLPRWSYCAEEGRGLLSVALDAERDAELAEPVQSELLRIMAALESSPSSASIVEDADRSGLFVDAPQSARNGAHPAALDWAAYIAMIHDELEAGRFEKIVAVRRCIIDLTRPLDSTVVFRHLVARYPQCSQFLFRRDGVTFLGATPETLFDKGGNQLYAQALAGTRRISPALDTPEASDELLASGKDLWEHRLVVREICDRLRDLCERVDCAERPEIRRVGNIVHLDTPISASARSSTHAVDVLAKLHPTPAIGGVPPEAAAEWIAEHESAARGWFSGAVGWLDAQGDASFRVAIRSAVISREQAFVYAGAGIVRGSDAMSEYAETGLKLEPMLGAIGSAIRAR